MIWNMISYSVPLYAHIPVAAGAVCELNGSRERPDIPAMLAFELDHLILILLNLCNVDPCVA